MQVVTGTLAARLWMLLGGALVLAALSLVVGAQPALADDPCNTIICDDDGDVILNPEDPGNPGDPGGVGTGDTGGGTRVCTFNGNEIPCTSPDGATWYQPYGCYLTLSPGGGPPPPDATNPDGAWYLCQPQGLPPTTIWIDDPPVQLPSPAELAQEALERMNLEPIDIGIVPEDQPGRLGLVGLPVWMWVQNPAGNGP